MIESYIAHKKSGLLEWFKQKKIYQNESKFIFKPKIIKLIDKLSLEEADIDDADYLDSIVEELGEDNVIEHFKF